MDVQKQFLPKSARFQPRKIVPSSEQLAIALATQKIILIDANAGAAKTTTLALRMAESLARGVAPASMLALTVTQAAAQVLQQRLKQIGVAAAVVRQIRIQTFEALARDILRSMEQVEVPYSDDLADLIPVAQQALRAVAERYGRRHALDMQTHNVAIHTFLRMQAGIKARYDLLTHDLEGYAPEEIADVLNVPLTTYLWHLEYEALRGADQQIEFRAEGDAVYDLIQALQQQPEAMAFVPAYQVIIADELHDLNEVTFRLLTHLIRMGNAFFCGAGDKDQVIYSWRGADHQYLRHRFGATFPNLATYPLTACYRHGSTLARAVAQFKQKENRSASRLATSVQVVTYDSANPAQCSNACASATLAALQAYLQGGGKAGACAILLRSPGQSIALENALLQAGIGFRTEGMPLFLQRPDVLMLRAMMALGLQNLASVPSRTVREAMFDAMLMFAEIRIDYDDHAAWLKDRDTAINQPNALEWFLDGVLIRRARHSRDAIVASRDYLRGLPADAPAGEALQQVVELLRLPDVTRRVFVDPQQAAMVQESVGELIALARASQLGLHAFSAWLGQTEAQLGQAGNKDGVVLACVDEVKGREYDAVFMPGLARGCFPRRGVAMLEEENRFYVAITRTREHLVLLAPSGEEASPFLARLGL